MCQPAGPTPLPDRLDRIFTLSAGAADLLETVSHCPPMDEKRILNSLKNGTFPQEFGRTIEHGEILYNVQLTRTLLPTGKLYLHLSLSRRDHKRLALALCEPFRKAFFGDRSVERINSPSHPGYSYQWLSLLNAETV